MPCPKHKKKGAKKKKKPGRWKALVKSELRKGGGLKAALKRAKKRYRK